MTLGVDPESKEEVEVGPPGLIAVVEETLDGTNWNEIGRLLLLGLLCVSA